VDSQKQIQDLQADLQLKQSLLESKDAELALTKAQQSMDVAKINEQLTIVQTHCKSQLDQIQLQS